MYGGATKRLDVSSDPRPGYYFSPVIPTKTGSITIDLKGEIDGVDIDVQIPIEDVESTSILDFPPVSETVIKFRCCCFEKCTIIIAKRCVINQIRFKY